MSDNKGSTIGYLVEEIGLKNTIELIELALPSISTLEANFSKSLLSNDIDMAAKYAHKALGSVRLYGTTNLENLLMKIKDKKLAGDKFSQIINEVCVELKLTHITLNNWLKTQSV